MTMDVRDLEALARALGRLALSHCTSLDVRVRCDGDVHSVYVVVEAPTRAVVTVVGPHHRAPIEVNL